MKKSKLLALLLALVIVLPLALTGCNGEPSLKDLSKDTNSPLVQYFVQTILDDSYPNMDNEELSETELAEIELIKKLAVPYSNACRIFSKGDLKSKEILNNENALLIKGMFFNYGKGIQILGFNYKTFLTKVAELLKSTNAELYSEAIADIKLLCEELEDGYTLNADVIYADDPEHFVKFIKDSFSEDMFDDEPLIIDKFVFLSPTDADIYKMVGKTIVENGVTYSKDKSVLIEADIVDVNFTIPNTVKYIANSAFKNTKFVKTINVPSSVKYVGSNALKNSNVTTINLQLTKHATKDWGYNWSGSATVNYYPTIDFNNMPKPDTKPLLPEEIRNVTYYKNKNLASFLYNNFVNDDSSLNENKEKFYLAFATNVTNDAKLINKNNIVQIEPTLTINTLTTTVFTQMKTFAYDFEFYLLNANAAFEKAKAEVISNGTYTESTFTTDFPSASFIEGDVFDMSIIYSKNTHDLVKHLNKASYNGNSFIEVNDFAILNNTNNLYYQVIEVEP